MRLLLILTTLLAAAPAAGPTIVEMELVQAKKLLVDHGLAKGAEFLARLANNYKKINNVRIHSQWHEEAIGALARALRTDFDGSGGGYIPELTVWAIRGDSGARVYLAASQMDSDAVLMASDIDYLRGMVAYEILSRVRDGSMPLVDAQHKAMAMGIEMQVSENTEGERTITFFGHQDDKDKIVGKIMVIEPPELVWK